LVHVQSIVVDKLTKHSTCCHWMQYSGWFERLIIYSSVPLFECFGVGLTKIWTQLMH